MNPSTDPRMELAKANFTSLETLESVPVLWNPSSYRLERSSRFAAPATIGSRATPTYVAGGEERFSTRLLLDTSREPPGHRNAARWVTRIERWSRPAAESGLPERVLFAWGEFRFRGFVESVVEEWVLFDPDGTPVRGWIDVVLRS